MLYKIAYTMQNIGVDLKEDVGPSILINETLKGLRRAGHDVQLVRLNNRDVDLYAHGDAHEKSTQIAQNIAEKHIFRVVESGVRRIQGILRFPYLAAFDSFRFYQATGGFLPTFDICHEYQGLFSLGAIEACRKLGKPHVLTVDADLIMEREVVGDPLRGWHKRLARWEAARLYALTDHIMVVSEAAKRHFVAEWGISAEKMSVIPNGVDIARFSGGDGRSLRSVLGWQDKLIVGFVGGFQPWHGIDKLVDAFAIVAAELPDARLLLVGDGPVRAAIERQISSLGLDAVTHITGFVAHDAVPDRLAAFDVATVPYPQLAREMWFSPLKLFEYMAAGKPIVASSSGQIVDVLEDGNTGLLVMPGDVAQLSDALLQLLQSPKKRSAMAENAYQQAVSKHSWMASVAKVEAVYERVLGYTK